MIAKKFHYSFLLIALLAITNVSFGAFPIQPKETKTEIQKEFIQSPEAIGINGSSGTRMGANAEYDFTITLLLAIFLGAVIGLHRWYTQKPVGVNLLYMITAGGLGIWWLIDIFRILTQTF